MSSVVLDAISRLTGNEFLSRCLKLCEFDDFSELINIDENTLDQMEIFLQKKCAKMSINERRIFIGDNFAENPDIFKFSPGIRQKFLNVMENLSKIFTTSNLPLSLFNLKEICHRYEINNKCAITTIPRNALKMVLANENLPTEFINNIPGKSVEIIDEPLLTDVSQGIVIKKPLEPYPNIFHRMDLLRKGEIEINKNLEEKEKNILSVKNKENFITNKENKEQTEELLKAKRISMKRKADDDPDYEEPVKKKLHEYRKYNKKLKTFKKVKLFKSDSIDSNNSAPLRIKSQRLMDKYKVALEPKKTEEPTGRVKRKYTKRVKMLPEQITMPENTQVSIVNSQLANGPTKLHSTEKFNEKEAIENEGLENLSSHKIYKVSKTANEIVSAKLNHLNVKQLTASDAVQNLNVKNSAEKLSTNRTSYLKILPNPLQTYGVRLIGPLNNNEKVFTKSFNFHKNLENFEKLQSQSKTVNPDPNLLAKPDSIKLLLTESKNVDKLNEHILKVPLNPAENPARQINPVQNVIVQSKIINSSQLKVNIVSSSDTNQSNAPFDVNIQKVTLSSHDQFNKINQLSTPQTIKPKLKLSDVPFQCFEVKKAPIKNRHINAMTKNNIQKISINPSVQQKNSNVDSKTKMQSSIIRTNQLKVIQIPKIPMGNQIIQPSKENFTDQINPIKSTSSSNFRFEPVKLFEKSILLAKTPTVINSGGLEVTPEKIDNFKQMMNNSLDFPMNPQWTSTPNFIANRFINATKHQKSNSESGKTVENKSQSESEKFVATPKQYRY